MTDDSSKKAPDGSGTDRNLAFMARLKRRYQQAYDAAVDVGKEKLDDLRRAGAGIEPAVKQMIGDGLQSAGRTLEHFNRTLARKAIPPSRRKNGTESDGNPPTPPTDVSGQ
jgi:hypothetical protein